MVTKSVVRLYRVSAGTKTEGLLLLLLVVVVVAVVVLFVFDGCFTAQ